MRRSTVAAIPRELIHFLLLDREAQAVAIRRMAALGWSEYGIAAATRLSIEQVRRILAEPSNALDESQVRRILAERERHDG